MKKWLFWRRAVQFLSVALLFVPLFWANPFWVGTYLSSDFFSLSLTDPLAALEVFLAGKEFYLPLFFSALPLILVAAVLGRVFCGWICPLNTLLELFACLKLPRRQESGVRFARAPYFVLGFVLLASLFLSMPFFTVISPIGFLSRAVYFGMGIELLLVAAIVSGELIWGRKAWCRAVCPVGALYGLLGRFKIWGVTIDDSLCVDCGQCHSACSMRVKVGSAAPLQLMNCTNCADCIDSCPQGAVKLTSIFIKKGERGK